MYARQGNAQATYTQLIAAAELDTDPDSASAMRHLAELLGENNPAELARVAKELKPWSVYVFTGLIYDTNINGGPNSDLIPGVIGDSSVIFKLNRSEEHTSELQSLMRISYAVFCLKTKKQRTISPYET